MMATRLVCMRGADSELSLALGQVFALAFALSRWDGSSLTSSEG